MKLPRLVSGNRTYSSSSLRAWLLLNEFDIAFDETVIELFKDDSIERIAMYSPSLKLPVLVHGDIKVWDSLAICEYINESFLEGRAWPANQKKKAAARSIANELHADFQQFKKDWPMNCQLQTRMKVNGSIEEEIARLDAIMYACRSSYGDGGDYLFGNFSIADCMLAPMVIALKAYGAELTQKSWSYINTLLSNPNLEWWLEQAENEQQDYDWNWEQTA
ncbi:MAG: glutathione S-transferase [Gammaproteobacteria bacterium]|nr:glutathione S-transferase [Gammaproteobacteria bacterium]MAY03141.1 glutathione S-transferase [Gammaproteobacteria bacterium]|tara:strand:- start:3729 stop:4388 length:660 start_codon:yes stop_codon:yes gene_type:complete